MPDEVQARNPEMLIAISGFRVRPRLTPRAPRNDGLVTTYAASPRRNPFHIAVAAPEVSTGR